MAARFPSAAAAPHPAPLDAHAMPPPLPPDDLVRRTA
jgi:hypothetical protein